MTLELWHWLVRVTLSVAFYLYDLSCVDERSALDELAHWLVERSVEDEDDDKGGDTMR
jgi:hypothetical protein